MKKQIVSMAIILIMILLSACTPTETNILEYQTYPFSAKGSMTANGIEYVFEAVLTDKNKGELKFSSPDSLRGYLFNVSPEGTTLSYDNMTIDFSNNGEKTNIVNLIPGLFSLDEANLTSKSDTTQNSVELTVATFKTDKGDVTVYINKQTCHPMRFEQNGTVVNITEFVPSTPQTKEPAPTPTASKTPTQADSTNE